LIATAVFPKPSAAVTVTIGGLDAQVVEYAGAAPFEVAGVLQINVSVPAGVTPGDTVPVIVTIGNSASQNNLTVSVR
jgi:uncharacterized protein (TIGR03437 family)